MRAIRATRAPTLDRRALLAAGLAFLAPGRLARGQTAAGFSADAFVDSVGVNTHLTSEPYASRFDVVRSRVAEAGIRHLRDELPPPAAVGLWRQLFDAHGIRGTLLVSPVKNTIAEVVDTVEAIGAKRLAGIEGQNEGDGDWFKAQPVAGSDWAAAVTRYQAAVYHALRATHDAATLPMLSPSVLDYAPADVLRIRAAATSSDIASIHSYVQRSQEPETTDDYAGISWYLRHMAEAFKAGATVMSTEAGYNTLVRPGAGVSEAAAATYMPRLLLNNFAAGVRRTFLYELMDEGSSPNDSEQHWGLLRPDGTPKPAYRTVAALLRGFTDERGSARQSPPPQLSLPGASPDLRRLDFVKADGSALIALWRAVRCWDPARSTDLPVAEEPQSLVFDRPPRFCRSTVLNEHPSWQEHPALPDLAVAVGARVRLLRFG